MTGRLLVTAVLAAALAACGSTVRPADGSLAAVAPEHEGLGVSPGQAPSAGTTSGGGVAGGTSAGSTASGGRPGAMAGGSDAGVTQPGAPGSTTRPPAGPTAPAQSPMAATPGAAQPGSQEGTESAPLTPTNSLPPSAHPGADDQALRLGAITFDTAAVNTLVSNTGAEGSSAGDPRAQQQAVVDVINAEGGMAGRQVELVFHQLNLANDLSTEYQAMCAEWTDDGHVFAGTGATAGFNEQLVSCLASKDTVAVGASFDVGAQAAFGRYPDHLYSPSSLALDVATRAYVEGLDAQGYFDPGDGPLAQPKVGYLYYNFPEYLEAREQGFRPALAAAGFPEPVEQEITYSGNLRDYGQLVAQVQSSVLRFRSEGVTHVLFLDNNSSQAFFFIQTAAQQGYYPRYGFSTLSAPQFLTANFTATELGTSLGVGWIPAIDVNGDDMPPSAARERCLAIMESANLVATSGPDMANQFAYCSQYFLLDEALDRVATVDVPSFRNAVESLGAIETTSPMGLTDRFAAGKHWGGDAYAYFAYVGDCACYRYVGQPIPAT